MSKTKPSLFSDSSSDAPVIFNANTVPRLSDNRPVLTFRFNAGELGLSLGLISLLNLNRQDRQVAFVNFKGNAYITRVDRSGLYVELRIKEKYGLTSGQISSKRFVQDAVREMGFGVGDMVKLPVASYSTTAIEIGVDPKQYPNPFYRIVRDQIAAK